MHDHAQSERDRQAYELQEGYTAKRRLKYVNRYVEYLSSVLFRDNSAIASEARKIALCEPVTVEGVGVFSISLGFVCDGCNRLAGEHKCLAGIRDLGGLLDCDCKDLACGAVRFKRNCARPPEVKNRMVW